MTKYDAIIIGSGQGGNPLAKKLADNGWRVALVERRKVGGTCVNDGCTPTKAMIASAKTASLIGKSGELGIKTSDWSADLSEIVNRKNSIVKSFRESSQKRLEETKNLELIFGEAVFSGHKTIEVKAGSGSFELSADHIFINTGTKPRIPEIDGINQIDYLTSTTILDMKEIPEHLLVLGGGPIALEFAQMFRRFGSKITVLEKESTILAREDDDVSEEVINILQEDGIQVVTGGKVRSFKRDSGRIKAAVLAGEVKSEVICTHVLIATGRNPNTEDLNLGVTRVETDERGFVKVNDRLETTAENIYAIGDVKGGPKFTHVSYNDHLILVQNLLENGNASIKNRLIPYCIFIDPQYGKVGLSEKEANEKGLDIKVAKLPMKYVARAIETGETQGFMKAVVDSNTGKILGAAVLGSEGGEIMSVLQMAIMGEVTYDKIRNGIFAHPTYAESLNNLFMSL